MATVKNFSKAIFKSAKEAEKAALKALSPLSRKLRAATKTLAYINNRMEGAQKRLEKARLKLETKMTLANKKSFTATKNTLKKLGKAAEKALKAETIAQNQFDACQHQVNSTLELVAVISAFQKKGDSTSKKSTPKKKSKKISTDQASEITEVA